MTTGQDDQRGDAGEPMDGRNDAGYLTTGRATTRLGISTSPLYRAMQRGRLTPYYRTPGGYQRFRSSDSETYARLLLAHGATTGGRR